MKDFITVEETYSKEGYLIRLKIDDLYYPVPEQEYPSVQIFDSEISWVTDVRYMTKEEVKNKYGKEI